VTHGAGAGWSEGERWLNFSSDIWAWPDASIRLGRGRHVMAGSADWHVSGLGHRGLEEERLAAAPLLAKRAADAPARANRRIAAESGADRLAWPAQPGSAVSRHRDRQRTGTARKGTQRSGDSAPLAAQRAPPAVAGDDAHGIRGDSGSCAAQAPQRCWWSPSARRGCAPTAGMADYLLQFARHRSTARSRPRSPVGERRLGAAAAQVPVAPIDGEIVQC
jgi:hypothetical protein